MPTFFDSTADTAEASEALRGLAHPSRGFDQPAEMTGVIGDLSSGMRSLGQALDQIADVHERTAAHAFYDAGNHEAGVRDALTAAEELRRAANLVDRAYDRLTEGFVAAGRIAWHPEPAVEEAALENGYVYDEPGQGTNDRVVLSGDYALVVNPHVGYASLLRRYTEPEAQPQDAEQVGPAPVYRAGRNCWCRTRRRALRSGPTFRRRSGKLRGSSRPRSRQPSRRGGWCVTYF